MGDLFYPFTRNSTKLIRFCLCFEFSIFIVHLNKQTNFNDIYIYTKGTVYLHPQIAKANRGERSYTQSVVKPIIIKLHCRRWVG